MSRRPEETQTHLSADADSAMTWTSAHVFCHDDLDALLTEAVAPLAVRLTDQGLIRGFFYLRYWDGGPHVRVRLRSAPAHVADVRQAVTDQLGAYLRTSPSREVLDDTAYRSSAAHLASEENRTDYERTLRPPDTIGFEDYPPEHTSFGHGTSLQAVEEHFCDSTAIALRTLALTPQQQLSAAMVMTLATEITLLSPKAGVNTPPRHNDESWGEELVVMYARLRAATRPRTAAFRHWTGSARSGICGPGSTHSAGGICSIHLTPNQLRTPYNAVYTCTLTGWVSHRTKRHACGDWLGMPRLGN